MPTLNKRTCANCGDYEETFSKSVNCLKCYALLKKLDSAQDELKWLTANRYAVTVEPTYDKFGKRCYTVTTPCGHEWTAPYGNLVKQIKNSISKCLGPACGVCGPKHRFTKALEKYVEKYGVDYDLDKANDYRRKVRGLTEVTYRRNRAIINPLNLKRGHHEHHLDHIVSIIECFKRGWTAEEASDVSNLQFLSAGDNLAKGRGPSLLG